MRNHRPKRKQAEKIVGRIERVNLRTNRYSIFDSVGWLARAAAKKLKVKRLEKSAKA